MKKIEVLTNDFRTHRDDDRSSRASEDMSDENSLPEGADPMLWPHGREWEEIPGTIIDERINGRYQQQTRIMWTQREELKSPQEREPADYFYKFFPPKLVTLMIEMTNARLVDKRIRNVATRGEMYKWLGIRLAMALEPCKGGSQAYWSKTDDEGKFSRGANFEERTSMTYNRFRDIAENLAFCAPHGGIREDEVSTTFLTTNLVLIFLFWTGGPLEGGASNHRPIQRVSTKVHYPWRIFSHR